MYTVEHSKTDKVFALKVMSKAKLFEYNIECQIANEIEIMTILSHKNIVKLYYYFETKEEISLLLEFAKLGNLWKLIKEKEKIIYSESRKIYS